MDAARFLSLIDLAPTLPFLSGFYCEAWRSRHPPEAMLRLVAYRMVKGYTYLMDLWRDLASKPDVVKLLGFEHTPSYQAIWHFINVRLKAEGFERIRSALLRLVDEALQGFGVEGDGSVSVDATPIQALRKDREAAYNGYYGMLCHLLHKVVDCSRHLTLAWTVTPGDVDEAGILTPLLLKAASMGFKVKEAFMDNGYSSPWNYATLALIGVKAWIAFRRRTRISWRGRVKTLKLRYRKMVEKGVLNHEALKFLGLNPTPRKNGLKQLLLGLLASNQHEYVGAYHRNISLRSYRKNQKRWLKRYYAKRNIVEGTNGHQKTQLKLDRLSSKGLEKAKLHVSQVLLTETIIAYAKTQRGITNNLTSLAHII